MESWVHPIFIVPFKKFLIVLKSSLLACSVCLWLQCYNTRSVMSDTAQKLLRSPLKKLASYRLLSTSFVFFALLNNQRNQICGGLWYSDLRSEIVKAP